MCLAQGHSAVTPVRLEPAASWSQVKHSTTKPLRSHINLVLALSSTVLPLRIYLEQYGMVDTLIYLL